MTGSHTKQAQHTTDLVFTRPGWIQNSPFPPPLYMPHCGGCNTKLNIINDTVEYQHSYISQPTLTTKDCIVHSIQFPTCAIKDASAQAHHNHLDSITKLGYLFGAWYPYTASAMPPQYQPHQCLCHTNLHGCTPSLDILHFQGWSLPGRSHLLGWIHLKGCPQLPGWTPPYPRTFHPI